MTTPSAGTIKLANALTSAGFRGPVGYDA